MDDPHEVLCTEPPKHSTYHDVMAGQDLHEALLELEREGWNSLCESTGDEFYGRTMSDDAVMVLAHGEVMDRSMAVAARRTIRYRDDGLSSVRSRAHAGEESAGIAR